MQPSKEIQETARALVNARVCRPAEALIDAGEMHCDPTTRWVGVLLTYAASASSWGVRMRARQRKLVQHAA